MQAVLHHVLFNVAKLNPKQNVSMSTALPETETWLLAYIDGLDTIRRIPISLLHALDKEGSPQHLAFVKACRTLQLPLHATKTLVHAFSFKVLGGEINGITGTLSISSERQAKLIGEAFRLLSLPHWSSAQLSRIVGNFAYAALFRRPAFSILADVFALIAEDSSYLSPTPDSVDEIVLLSCLLPLCVSNLRAPFRQLLSASDASNSGASVCEATTLLHEPPQTNKLQHRKTCQHSPLAHSCPCCHFKFCSRACGFVHLDSCTRALGKSTFQEFTFNIVWHVSGSVLDLDTPMRPPIQFASKDVIEFPPLTTTPCWYHLTLFKSNFDRDTFSSIGQKFLRFFRQCVLAHSTCTLQLIDCSYLSYSPLAVSCLQLPSVQLTKLCLHCYAGLDGLGCHMISNNPQLHQTWHHRCNCNFQDSPLPIQAAQEYAAFVKTQLTKSARTIPPSLNSPTLKPWLHNQLQLMSQKSHNPEAQQTILSATLLIIQHAANNNLEDHLKHLASYVDLRGSDIRLSDSSLLAPVSQTTPYPAFIWEWKSKMTFPFQHSSHINILELLAVVYYIEQTSNSSRNFHTRIIHLLDSQVTCAILSKGRSSSKQLNRILRRLAATLLASDTMLLPLWTSTTWQPADRGSRLWSDD